MRQTDGRQAFQRPSRVAFAPDRRQREIDRVCATFVAAPANKAIYRLILERLFPEGSGVPGPVVTQAQVREAVQAGKEGYRDVFRRMRELQGEEGITGIIKGGSSYQLISLAVGPKRIPRQPISRTRAQAIAERQGWRCSNCGTPIVAEGPNRFDPDHKIPRTRGGTNDDTNLQGLCPACNNAKSGACANCAEECRTCPWAFPEQYRLPRIRPDLIRILTTLATNQNRTIDDVANEMLDEAFQ